MVTLKNFDYQYLLSKQVLIIKILLCHHIALNRLHRRQKYHSMTKHYVPVMTVRKKLIDLDKEMQPCLVLERFGKQ